MTASKSAIPGSDQDLEVAICDLKLDDERSNLLQRDGIDVRSMIYVVRGQQVMLDRDLARLYGVNTKRINEACKRNTERFPEQFRFQLTWEEEENLRSQIATSSSESSHGGNRYPSYVFTEQGVAMLSAVLRSETAIRVSVQIMNAFVEMRRFLASNAGLFSRIDAIETRQLEFQRVTDERFEQVFRQLEGPTRNDQVIFFDGQVFDAFSLLAKIIGQAQKSLILIDAFVGTATLDLLAKKLPQVQARIVTHAASRKHLTESEIRTFDEQYPTLSVVYDESFHDRFLILDGKTAYHIGASLKDAGKRCFALSLLQDRTLVEGLLKRLKDLS